MATHEEQKELLALAALGALDGDEGRALEAHLAGCAECRAELRSLSDAAAALAFASAPVAPSPELRSRILSQLRTTPQQAPAGAAPQTDAGGDGRERLPGGNVVSFEEARSARPRKVVFSRPAFAFGAVAATLLVAALLGATALLWRRNGDMQAQLAALSVALEQTRAQLGQTRTELASARSTVDLLAAPDTRTAELAGTKMAVAARARITYDARTGEAMLTASNLPVAPAGKAYQLWYIAGGKPLPGSVFTADPRGRAEMHTTIPPEGRNAVFAVTLEPAGGLPAPSGEVYLKGGA